jgi:hypothetical protein
MNLSAELSLTTKGLSEVLDRVYKRNIRQRSVLILLASPQTVDFILKKQQGLFPAEETIEIINDLARDGFIDISGGYLPPRKATPTEAVQIQLLNDIVISEAQFLLADFCVDSFGTRSQPFVDEINKCGNANSLQLCLKRIHAATQVECPEQLPVLHKIIAEINMQT